MRILVIIGILVSTTAMAQVKGIRGIPLDQRPFPACETLQRFGGIPKTNGLYHGSMPLTERDFQCLKAMKIKTIVSLELRVIQKKSEAQLAAKYGITFLEIPMQPSPIPPLNSTAAKALSVIADQSLWPLYFHCYLGRDRTMLMVGLYETKYLGKTPNEAWADMLSFGFSTKAHLWGLQHFYWDNAEDRAEAGVQQNTPEIAP